MIFQKYFFVILYETFDSSTFRFSFYYFSDESYWRTSNNLYVNGYLRLLEEAVILTLKEININAGRVKGLTGVWINHKSNLPKKICAMGVKTSRWVTMHGLALNVNTELKYFENIIPCGIQGKDVTSIENETNKKVSISDIENKLINNLSKVFEFKILDDEV